MKQSEEKDRFVHKYRSDDFNYQEFDGHVDIAQFCSAIKQAPMFADYYVVLLHVDRKQFIRIAEFLHPAEFTALLLICDGFNLTEEMLKDLPVDQVIDCRPLTYRESVKWIKARAGEFGYSLELDDRKKLALMFKSSKELSDVLFQMSMLNDFDRREFFNDLFRTKQEFVWDLFISLTEGNNKTFFKKYAEQLALNVELSKSQFNMKIVGGLLFCLNHAQDAPEWISVKLKTLNENGEKLIPFLHSHLIETLVLARKEQSNIPVLMRFVSIMSQVSTL
jgi:hypothetical protein